MARVQKIGTYTVHDNGDVFNKKGKLLKSRVRKCDKGRGGGYVYIDMNLEKGKKTTFLLHRLVATLFIENPDNLSDVNHKDGNRVNNCVENLEWLNRSDNQKHAYSNVREDVGENHHFSKLTNEERLEIRRLRNIDGLKLKEIAEMFNINFRTVSEIARGKRHGF